MQTFSIFQIPKTKSNLNDDDKEEDFNNKVKS